MWILNKKNTYKGAALLFTTVVVLSLSALHANADNMKSIGSEPAAVIELFTSQGCSSCPSADKVLGKIKAKGDVLALAWHVDYWDYIGWKDTFAKPDFTERQRAYARSLRERQIYTPQVIVNGYDHAVGSSNSKIERLLEVSKSQDGVMSIPIAIVDDGDDYAIQIKGAAANSELYVTVVFYNDVAEVKVTRGENRGKILTYHNIVVGAKSLGQLKSDGFFAYLSKDEIKQANADNIAVLVQAYSKGNRPGLIHGAKIIN
jgi:hypothetical protein